MSRIRSIIQIIIILYETCWVALDAFINEGLAEEGGKRVLNTQGEWLDSIETQGGHEGQGRTEQST